MITVGGFNTSVDKAATTDEVRPGAVHRLRDVRWWPGGKGLHVALTAAALGEPVRLVGLIDAGHRAAFEAFLAERGVEFHGVDSPGGIRSCLAVRDPGGSVTEFLEAGPPVEPATRDALLARFRELAGQSELAVLSGSLPPGFDDSAYAELVTGLAVRCIVDASGGLLREAVRARPFMVKPNRQEAEALTGGPIESLADAARAARALEAEGIALAMISLGPDGALACADGRVRHGSVSVAGVANTVGSGDCLVGGAAVAVARGQDAEAALRLGVACGAANALSPETGIVRRRDVDTLLRRVQLAELS